MDKKVVSTEELLTILEDYSSLKAFFDDYEKCLPNLTTAEYLEQLLNEHHISKQEAIRRADIDRVYGYQLLNGKRNARRNTLLRLALAIPFSVDETQRLLKIAQRGELYVKNRRDAAIIYCLMHEVGLIETELLLDNIGEALLR